MKKTTFFFLISLLFFKYSFCQVKINKSSNWVSNVNYSKNPDINKNDINQGLLTLLYDEQVNTYTKETFIKIATKVTDNVGTQSASNISIIYDPSFQKLTFHTINVIRGKKTINKLNNNSFQTMRRELNSENYIYDGSLSAVTNLSDVRNGDIIEYSYTIKGFNPIHKNHYSNLFNLRSSNPIGKLYIKILSNDPLNFKYFKTNLKVKASKFQKLNAYTFIEKNIEAFKYEDNTPSWNIESGLLNVSNYKSWKQVVDWGVKVYKYNQNLSPQLLEKIKEIQKNNDTEGEKIKATLTFVQDEIRYLGLESGIGAYKPFSPNKVFNQRFGDCKDKSILLVAMLNKMGIEAYPALINTYLKGTLTKLLPSPYQFNHCVAKIIYKNGGEYWYDPTISNQGGKYNSTVFPDYRYGLVLKKGNKELENIYPFNNNLVEITDNYVLNEVGKGATLNIESIYNEGEADNMRSFFKNNSISSIKKEYEKYYSKYFNDIESLKNPEYSDNLKENIFTIKESYKIDSIWKNAVVKNHLAVEFTPYSIVDILSFPNKSVRNEPYAVVFPATRNHVINVILPEKWGMSQEGNYINSPNLYYDFNISYLKNQKKLTLNHSLKIQKDYVAADEFTEYYRDLSNLDSKITYSIMVPKDGNVLNGGFSFLKILGFIIFWGAFFLFIWLAIKLYKFNPEAKVESYFEKNKAIGGWLILIGIGLCISPLRVLFDLFKEPMYISGDWILYFSSNNYSFNFGLGIILFLETIVNAALIVIMPLLVVLFFQKRSSFPKIYAIFLVSFFLFNVLDYAVATSLESSSLLKKNYMNMVLRMFISTSLIVPYILLSERAKETFVKTLKEN